MPQRIGHGMDVCQITLDQARLLGPVRDYQLLGLRSRPGADGVGQAHLLEAEGGEGLADLGCVVDRQDEAAFDLRQLIGHLCKLAAIEHPLAIIGFAPEIGRVEIEERPVAVIAVDQVCPVQAFQHHAIQALACLLEDDLQARQGKPRAVRGCHAENAADLTTEGQALQVEEPCGPLQVGQGAGVGGAQALELAPTGQLKAHDFHQLRIVALQDPEEVDDLAIQVIGYLERWAEAAAQEHAPHSHEGFDIGAVRDCLDPLDDAPVQALLAPQPRCDRGSGFDLFHSVILA